MIKNLKINKEFFKRNVVAALLIVTTMATGSIIHAKKIEKEKSQTIPTSFSSLVEKHHNHTTFDEYYNYDNTCALPNYDTNSFITTDTYEAINELERISALYNMINKEAKDIISKFEPQISKEDIQNIDEMVLAINYQELMNKLKGKSFTTENHNQIKLEIARIYSICEKWLDTTGRSIAIETLTKVVQSKVGNLLDLDLSEYNQIIASNKERSPKSLCLTSNPNCKVRVTSKSGVYKDAINAIWELDQKDNYKTNAIDAINLAKHCIMHEAAINDRLELVDIGLIDAKSKAR